MAKCAICGKSVHFGNAVSKYALVIVIVAAVIVGVNNRSAIIGFAGYCK